MYTYLITSKIIQSLKKILGQLLKKKKEKENWAQVSHALTQPRRAADAWRPATSRPLSCPVQHNHAGRTQGKVTDYFVKLSFQEEKSCLYSQPKVSPIISCGSFGTFSNIPGTLQRQTKR